MTETQQQIMKAVEDAGGSATWEQVISAVDVRRQQSALGEIRGLETMGLLKRRVVRDPETGQTLFSVDKVG